MNNTLKGVIDVLYVFSGKSKGTGNPYVQVSDGLEAHFVSIPKDSKITADSFSGFEKGQQIQIEVETNPLSGRTTLVSVVGKKK